MPESLTLTPFGFQNERRTLWQAPEVYIKMSPFMYANKIRVPLLLIHGEADKQFRYVPDPVRADVPRDQRDWRIGAPCDSPG
jgi:pimeloyl-ACP methyl ester carboxylesterase